jgi:tetratricopeptide (TPR) repeat protein
MKRIKILLGILLLPCIICNSQDRLQRAIERYDYKTALNVIDSLVAEIGTDSMAVAQNKETVIDLALQKSRCLRRLYRMDEAVEVLADVLYLDQYNVELMADLAESHMQAGNSIDAYNLYGLLSQMQPDNTYFKICKARILYREKQYGESIEICRDLIAKDSIPEIMAMTGDAYKNLNH